ncbi:hypothetical protein BC833DRAFT_618246 [Globomyces pollinis-pini]|nr:hypothetical protein BC833DRAFT_618246 [Globomyces pollinis-pini]
MYQIVISSLISSVFAAPQSMEAVQAQLNNALNQVVDPTQVKDVTTAIMTQDCFALKFVPCQLLVVEAMKGVCEKMSGNIDLFYKCQCFKSVSNGACYSQCPANKNLQASYLDGVAPGISNVCRIANVDTGTLPQMWDGKKFGGYTPGSVSGVQSITPFASVFMAAGAAMAIL